MSGINRHHQSTFNNYFCIRQPTTSKKYCTKNNIKLIPTITGQGSFETSKPQNISLSKYNYQILFTEYSSSSRKQSSGGRYESSSTYEGSGLTSSYSRRESGSRLESSKYESGGAIEGTASSRYESKYSSSSKIDGGSKYGIESSYESKTEGSKYGIEYDSGASKLDSIASKYGIESKYSTESDTASKIESIGSKYGLESNYESKTESSKYAIDSDTPSKIDSIAAKYASRRISIETSADGEKTGGISSKTESSYETVKNGGSSYESKYSKTAISNGSISTGFESARSVSKSESQDGRPIFTKTLEGQNIERKYCRTRRTLYIFRSSHTISACT